MHAHFYDHSSGDISSWTWDFGDGTTSGARHPFHRYAQEGTYTVEIPEELRPKLLTEKTGRQARWLEKGKQIVWLSDGKPASVSEKGEVTAYSFSAKQEVDREALSRIGL